MEGLEWKQELAWVMCCMLDGERHRVESIDSEGAVTEQYWVNAVVIGLQATKSSNQKSFSI
jgi:hypothetical protein